MSEQTIVALAGITGTLVGSLITSLIAARMHIRSKRMEARNALTLSRIDRREEIYSEFLLEANQLLLKRYSHRVPQPEDFTQFLGMVHQLSLLSSKVGSKAKDLADSVLDAQLKRDETTEDEQQARIQTLNERREALVNECRADLDALQGKI